jgi:sulfite reductase beta subunit
MALPKRQTDIGPPKYDQFIPPVIKKNYGKWKYHEVLSGGTMVHVAESGDTLHTVRVASPRILSTETIRDICDMSKNTATVSALPKQRGILVSTRAKWSPF